jgi:hypothetical protein
MPRAFQARGGNRGMRLLCPSLGRPVYPVAPKKLAKGSWIFLCVILTRKHPLYTIVVSCNLRREVNERPDAGEPTVGS